MALDVPDFTQFSKGDIVFQNAALAGQAFAVLLKHEGFDDLPVPAAQIRVYTGPDETSFVCSWAPDAERRVYCEILLAQGASTDAYKARIDIFYVHGFAEDKRPVIKDVVDGQVID